MTKRYALSAEERTQAGKGVARAYRREKKIPAVIYGDKKPPVTIALPIKEVSKEYHTGQMFTTLCDLDLGGEKHLVLARDVQTHPVKDNVMHVDFLRVTNKTKLTVSVPVEFVNYEQSKAAQEKAVLNTIRHEVDLVCLATAIPETIQIDMSGFAIGDAVKISDADMPEGSRPAIDDRDFTIVTISAPKLFVEEEVESEEAAEGEDGADGAEAKAEGEGGEDKPEDKKE